MVELLHYCPLIGQELHSDVSVTEVFPLSIISRLVSAFRNKFETERKLTSPFMIKYGNLSFPQFTQMVIAESKVEFSNQDQ